VPNLKRYTLFEKPNRPSGVLQAALKKAKLKPAVLPSGAALSLSTTVVKVYLSEDDSLPIERIIWRK